MELLIICGEDEGPTAFNAYEISILVNHPMTLLIPPFSF